jgi:predicted dehydrogenase
VAGEEEGETEKEMADPIRIGIVGCGSVMQRPYMALIEEMRCQGLVEVIAGCDIDEGKIRYCRERFGIPRVTQDCAQVIEAADVDLIMVLTSMREHGPIARAALEAGKHVLVEKPMATSLEEAALLVELARNGSTYLLCAPVVILSPTYQAIWRHIQRGDLGRVVLARGRYGWAGPWWGQWYYLTGGGPLFDRGVYNLASLTGWLGPVRRVMAMAGTAIPERVVDGERIPVRVEDNMHLLLDFGESVLAAVTTGFTMQKYRSPALELYGTRGTIQMLGDDWAPQGYELWLNEAGTWQIFEETAPHWPWTGGLRHLVECIHNGQKPLVTPEHAYHVLEVMIRALESGRDGEAKTVESSFPPPPLEAAEGAEAAPHLVHDRRHR